MSQQGIDQGTAVISGCRVDYHPWWLVDHYQGGVFIDNIQRDGFRQGASRLRLREGYLYPFTDFKQVMGLYWLLINLNLLPQDKLLDLGAGEGKASFSQKNIQPLPVMG